MHPCCRLELATTVIPLSAVRAGGIPSDWRLIKVDLEPDFEELDLSHERPQDLVRCENTEETLAVRRLAARMLRRRKPVARREPR